MAATSPSSDENPFSETNPRVYLDNSCSPSTQELAKTRIIYARSQSTEVCVIERIKHIASNL